MKNYNQLVGGMVIGALIATGGTAFANSSAVPVITNWVKFKFNGETKALPSGYTVLSYDGRTYVPARFVAEELGADVKWDVNTSTVLIDKKETETTKPSDEKPDTPEVPSANENQSQNQNQTPSQEKPAVTYEVLPASQTSNGVSVEIYEVDQSNYEHTKLYFRVKNSNDAPMQLVQASGYLEAEGIKYEHTGIQSSTTGWKDVTWFTDLNEDDDNEGYIMVEKIPNDIKQGTVHVEVLQNDRAQKVTSYDLNVKWN